MSNFSAARIWVVVAAGVMILGTRAPWYTQRGGPISRSLTEQHPGLAFAISACAALPLLVALVSLTIVPNDRPNVATGMALAGLLLAALGLVLSLTGLSIPAAQDVHGDNLGRGFGPAISIIGGAGAVAANVPFLRWLRGART
jgi:hypothetical protein